MSQKQPVGMAVAKFDYKPTDCHELNITKGEKLTLLDDSQHWWQVMNAKGDTGYVPSNFCKKSKQGIFSSLRNTLGRKKNKESNQPMSCGASSVGTAPSSAGGRRSAGASPKPNSGNNVLDTSNSSANHGTSHNLSSSSHRQLQHDHPVSVSAQGVGAPMHHNNNSTFCSSVGSLKSNGSSNRGLMVGSGNGGAVNSNLKSGQSMSYNVGQLNQMQSMLPAQLPQYPLQKGMSNSEEQFQAGSRSHNMSPQQQAGSGPNNHLHGQQPAYGGHQGISSEYYPGAGGSQVNRNMMAQHPNNPHQQDIIQNHNTGSLGQPSVAGSHLCTAKFSYTPCQPDELTLNRGDRIKVLEKSSDGWWRGELVAVLPPPNSLSPQSAVLASGWFPSNYVTLEKSSPAAQLGVAGSANYRSTTDSLGRQLHQTSLSGSHHSSMPSVTGGMHVGLMSVTTAGGGSSGVPDDESGGSGWPPSSSVAVGANNSQSHNSGNSIGRRRCSTVLTLFPFSKNQPEEMSFQANEILDVLDRPADDPDWWRCCNTNGDTGLVPTNYVRQLTHSSGPPVKQQTLYQQKQNCNNINRPSDVISGIGGLSDDPGEQLRHSYNRTGLYRDRLWYWGSISRMECESLLMKHGYQGQFVVRDSESHPGDLTVTMHAQNKCRNFKVHVDEQTCEFNIGQKVFSTIESLILHYRTHPIYKSDSERLYLTDSFHYSSSSSANLVAATGPIATPTSLSNF